MRCDSQPRVLSSYSHQDPRKSQPRTGHTRTSQDTRVTEMRQDFTVKSLRKVKLVLVSDPCTYANLQTTKHARKHRPDRCTARIPKGVRGGGAFRTERTSVHDRRHMHTVALSLSVSLSPLRTEVLALVVVWHGRAHGLAYRLERGRCGLLPHHRQLAQQQQ